MGETEVQVGQGNQASEDPMELVARAEGVELPVSEGMMVTFMAAIMKAEKVMLETAMM